jgi:WD40 repeat protein
VLNVLDPGDPKGETDVIFMPDGRLLSGGVGGLRIWDIESGTSELVVSEPMSMPTLHGQNVLSVRRMNSSNGSLGGVAVVHDLQSGRSRVLESHGDRVWHVAWHPSGEQVVTTDWNGAIRVGPVRGDEPHLLVGHEMRPYVSVHPNGSMLASAGAEGALRLWPMPEGQPFNALPADEFVARLRSLTNYRIVRDTESFTGYRLDLGPFPGWKDLPTW